MEWFSLHYYISNVLNIKAINNKQVDTWWYDNGFEPINLKKGIWDDDDYGNGDDYEDGDYYDNPY